MRRREFLKNSIKNSIFIPAAGVTLFYAISSCSSDDPAATTTGDTVGTQPVGTCTNVSAVIGANHGHTIVPPNAGEVLAMAPITLNLTVGGGHTHSVTLTAAELENLSKCGTVAATSTTDGHTHAVTFTGA